MSNYLGFSNIKRDKKKTVDESFLKINVNQFKVGFLNRDEIHYLTLPCNNRHYPGLRLKIHFYIEDDICHVTKKTINDNEQNKVYSVKLEYSNMIQNIQFHLSKAKLGGFRWWFVCPECSNKDVYLYLDKPNDTFACRKCKNYSYESVQKHDNRMSTKNIEEYIAKHQTDIENPFIAVGILKRYFEYEKKLKQKVKK